MAQVELNAEVLSASVSLAEAKRWYSDMARLYGEVPTYDNRLALQKAMSALEVSHSLYCSARWESETASRRRKGSKR